MSPVAATSLLLQAILFPNRSVNEGDPLYGIVNVTENGIAGEIKLEYNYSNGSSVYLGDAGPGYPHQLYPNFTYSANQSSTVSIHGTQLFWNTSFLLGPVIINETFSIFSITTPVNNIESWSETL